MRWEVCPWRNVTGKRTNDLLPVKAETNTYIIDCCGDSNSHPIMRRANFFQHGGRFFLLLK
ncbi:hypothetical protein [Rhizosphaericola mali]|uniref:Uncharacterized protein n=1 Tax=Rhizosphaericola mali TaxID=2545455 RepID=A0A5P2G4R0_9BACT|nr:hypothetical protein [Rhizosphaericola mali]QES89678.1 hypothetical protein E0W69_013745 [Rhizosphaericola mali]